MSVENRNFRSCYYQKVGFKGIEKNIIGQLLKENPVDLSKLNMYCSKFPLLPIYRKQIWDYLSEIVPPYPVVQEAVQEEHRCQYEDLSHAALILQLCEDDTAISRKFAALWLIESGQYGFNAYTQLSSSPCIHISTITEALLEIFTLDEDNEYSFYFLAKSLWQLHKKHHGTKKLKDTCVMVLERRDKEIVQAISNKTSFPLEDSFLNLFAGTLAISELTKVWDQVISGSYMFLAYVGATTLMIFKDEVMNQAQKHEIKLPLENLSERVSEDITEQAFELWANKSRPNSTLVHSVSKTEEPVLPVSGGSEFYHDVLTARRLNQP